MLNRISSYSASGRRLLRLSRDPLNEIFQVDFLEQEPVSSVSRSQGNRPGHQINLDLPSRLDDLTWEPLIAPSSLMEVDKSLASSPLLPYTWP